MSNTIPKIKVSGGTVTINNFYYSTDLSSSGELDNRSVTPEESTKKRAKETQPEKALEKVVDAKARLEAQRKHLEARKATQPIYKRLINSSNAICKGYLQTKTDLYDSLKEETMFATREQKEKLQNISTDIDSCNVKIRKYFELYKGAFKAMAPAEGILTRICTATEKQINTLSELTEEFNVLMLEILSSNEKEGLEELMGLRNNPEDISAEDLADGINKLSFEEYLQVSAILKEKQLKELRDSAVEYELELLGLSDEEEAIETERKIVTDESNIQVAQINAVGNALARPIGQRRAPAVLPTAPESPQYGLYDYTVGPIINTVSYMIFGSNK